MTENTARLSTALADRYRIERRLGEGGMATVYLADDLRHERKVALKVMKPELAAVLGAERFLAEIRTTANLQHPHILPLFDSGEADSFLFYVMPYVEGESLREKLERETQLPVDEAVRIASDVAEALDYAHRHGVIHRDIKPANILLHEGRPLIADFGIALALGTAGARLTETGLSLGTPYYMSPEQATGDQQVGPAADLYALGCVLYEMLIGEPPYVGATAQAVLGKVIQGGPVSATEQRPTVPANVDAAIRRVLEKLPADRFTGAQSFANALGDPAFRHGSAGTSAPASGVMSRRQWLAVGGTAAAAFALSTWWFVWGRSAPPSVIVLMDSTHPLRIYDPATIAEGGTNADDLTNILRDLPVVLIKENTNATWNRETEVLQQNPDLIVAHRSLFYNATLGGDQEFARLTAPLARDKFDMFMGYIGQGNPRTRFLVYSRGSWGGDPQVRQRWVESVESRFPALRGRVTAWQVPLDRATFRDPTTAAEIRAQVEALVELPREEDAGLRD
jgi:tRNA A-37 threonylcarbamoyl transferase component Bud32